MWSCDLNKIAVIIVSVYLGAYGYWSVSIYMLPCIEKYKKRLEILSQFFVTIHRYARLACECNGQRRRHLEFPAFISQIFVSPLQLSCFSFHFNFLFQNFMVREPLFWLSFCMWLLWGVRMCVSFTSDLTFPLGTFTCNIWNKTVL